MKEPWKKSCNGKVVITLNNDNAEKAAGGAATGPTEVEVPVDLAWANHRSEKRCSAPKAVILMGVVLVLGLTIITLFKVQNLVYSTTYVNWRMQELESAVNDNNDDVKLIKYKLDEFILDEKNDVIASMRGARAEPLMASVNSKNVDSDDLKLSESQNQNHKLTNSLNSEKKAVEATGKGLEVETKPKTKDAKEQTDLNDVPNHPNPTDPEEWIKPLVETFDIFGNQPMEDQFIQNVLMKLLAPENNFEVLELNKIQEAGNAAARETENQKMVLNPAMRPNENEIERINRPLTFPIESFMMKSLLPPLSNFKVFHLNERPEEQQQQPQQQQNSMEEEMPPKMSLKLKQMLPPAPVSDIFKMLLPPPSNMKIFQLNDNKQMPEQSSSEEDMPKITIQSVKMRLVPISEEFRNKMMQDRDQQNFEIIRLDESPEPSQEVEAPKMSMPISSFNLFPIPIHELILPGPPKDIEILPATMQKPDDQQQNGDSQQQQKRFNPLPIPLQDLVLKTLMPEQQSPQRQQQQESNEADVEITKTPVQAIHPFPIPESLMLPMSNYGGEPMHMINVAEQQQTQQSMLQAQQQQQEEGRQRSTKLNPVEEDWNMSTPSEPSAQN